MSLADLQNHLPENVRLVAVTKNRPAAEVAALIEQGVTEIGENRVQEAARKFSELPRHVTKHLIGHLQTNKAADAVRLFDMVQSVDRLKLAKKLSDACVKQHKTLPILIQVNTSREPQKSGVLPEQAAHLAREAATLPALEIRGLMTIAARSEREDEARQCFRTLKTLFDQIARLKIPNVEMEVLSMGMSEDYPLAIAEGATMVRVGRKLFG